MKKKKVNKTKINGRVFTGKVISTKMDKTIIVETTRTLRHALYKKIIRKKKKFFAHNETFDLTNGDKVSIQETKPMSKNKHFIVIQKH